MESLATSQTLRFLQQENRRLQEENTALRKEVQTLQEYMKSLRALYQASLTLSSESDLISLLNKILYAALNVLDASDGSLLLLDEEKGELVFASVLGAVSSSLPKYRIPKNMGVAGWVASNAEPLIVNSPRFDPRFSPHVDETFNFRTNSLICVPLIADERVIGVVEVLNKFSGEEFNENDLNLLTFLAHIAAIAIRKVEKHLEAEEDYPLS
ncbi:MAG: GAF domain-containing protein [Anaerolineae bacterium]